jgi:hypothetical protein
MRPTNVFGCGESGNPRGAHCGPALLCPGFELGHRGCDSEKATLPKDQPTPKIINLVSNWRGAVNKMSAFNHNGIVVESLIRPASHLGNPSSLFRPEYLIKTGWLWVHLARTLNANEHGIFHQNALL